MAKSTKERAKSDKKNAHEKQSIWVATYNTTGRLQGDQTGALPILGRHKEEYISIFYDESSNYIHAVPIKNASADSLLLATKQAITFFTALGSPIVHFRLDNEISDKVRSYLAKNNINIELTPVGQHRRNKAERAIRTFKNHFIASLAGIDKECPMELWPDFLDQIELTINLFRSASVGISAWSALHGPIDFNRTPIAPLGVKVVAHVPAERRASWAQHGDVGFYVDRALDHYRCYKVWIQKTKDFRISDCLAWFPVFNEATQPPAQYALVPPGFAPLTPLLPPTQGGKQRVVVTTTTPSDHIPVPAAGTATSSEEEQVRGQIHGPYSC